MSAKEIQKIRLKFIAVAMLSFFLVALFIGVLINAINFIVTQREIEYSTDHILEFKDEIEKMEYDSVEAELTPSLSELFSPAYRGSNFYIVTYDPDGTETSFYSSRGSADPDKRVHDRARELYLSDMKSGESGIYYFMKGTDEDGGMTIVMLNCYETMYSRMRLLYLTVAIGIASLVIAFILVVILSKKMIEPEIEAGKKQMQFLTNVSHELKTPLAVIRSNAEMEELLNGENEWTRSTVKQVDRMTGLIKNLVMITKLREIEDGREITEINMSETVRDTAGEFRAMAESEGKTLLMSVVEDIKYSAEESKIRQLLMILLDNAVKYCDDGGIIDVALSKIRRGRGIRLEVSNSYAEGEGLDCSRFFDRFYREDESHNIDTGGFGIGLSIAASIVEQYRGRIRAEWNDGQIAFICEM